MFTGPLEVGMLRYVESFERSWSLCLIRTFEEWSLFLFGEYQLQGVINLSARSILKICSKSPFAPVPWSNQV